MKKKVLTISCIVLLALIGTLTGGSLYMLNYSLRPENRGKDLQGSMEYMMQNYPQLKPWVDSLQQHHALKDTFITAPDGIRLHAYYAYASVLRAGRQSLCMATRTMPSGSFRLVISTITLWIITSSFRISGTAD